ncbi:hypothetical protein G9A89_008800 [Geosiphon pyriformis]|nr:hypothetical protein G9A89_008800 [Geosiphon pyriformis]
MVLGRDFTFSKFAGIIRMTFTSKLSLVQASKKAGEAKILVNTNLKKSSGCLNWAVVLKKILIRTSTKTVFEFKQIDHADLVMVKWSILIGKNAVHIAKSDINKESWDAQDIYKALLYTLSMETNAHDIWDYVALVGGKSCIINCHLVSYVRARCTIVCFDSAELLDAIIKTMPVLKKANLHWSCLVLAKCAGCGKLSHTLLACPIGKKKNVSSGALLWKTFSDLDKSRLAAIYAKCSVPIACPVSFGAVSWAQIAGESSFPPSPEIKPTPLVSLELNDRFVALERSLISLAEHVNMLAKKLDTLEPIVS